MPLFIAVLFLLYIAFAAGQQSVAPQFDGDFENAGPGNADRALKSWPETRRYVKQILADYEGN